MRLCVIIPALNEVENIAGTIGRTLGYADAEIIVVDGGSIDGTRAAASEAGAHVIVSPPGRAVQMNAGAAATTADTLLFLHADTALPDGYQEQIDSTLSKPGVVAGAFRLRIGSPSKFLRIISALANFRAKRLGLCYGDQGIFLRKKVFDSIGGFKEMPIMEDYELMLRLGGRGSIALADACVITSARRWEKLGVLCTTLINQLIIFGYHLGVKPERLKAMYKG